MIKILLVMLLLFSATTKAEGSSSDLIDFESSSASSSDSSSNEIRRSDSDNSVAIKDLTYWEAIEYFGLTPVFTLFPGPNSPVSEPTVFIGIASFDSFLQKVEEEVARMN
jgi:hypothetical protein